MLQLTPLTGTETATFTDYIITVLLLQLTPLTGTETLCSSMPNHNVLLQLTPLTGTETVVCDLTKSSSFACNSHPSRGLKPRFFGLRIIFTPLQLTPLTGTETKLTVNFRADSTVATHTPHGD